MDAGTVRQFWTPVQLCRTTTSYVPSGFVWICVSLRLESSVRRVLTTAKLQ